MFSTTDQISRGFSSGGIYFVPRWIFCAKIIFLRFSFSSVKMISFFARIPFPSFCDNRWVFFLFFCQVHFNYYYLCILPGYFFKSILFLLSVKTGYFLYFFFAKYTFLFLFLLFCKDTFPFLCLFLFFIHLWKKMIFGHGTFSKFLSFLFFFAPGEFLTLFLLFF